MPDRDDVLLAIAAVVSIGDHKINQQSQQYSLMVAQKFMTSPNLVPALLLIWPWKCF